MNRNLKEQLKKKQSLWWCSGVCPELSVDSAAPFGDQHWYSWWLGLVWKVVEHLFVVSRTWPPLSSWLLSGLLLLSATLVWKSSCLGCQAGKSFPKANKYRLSTWISSVWCKPLFPQSRSKLNFLFGAKGQSSDRNVRFVIPWNWEGRPEALCLELKI